MNPTNQPTNNIGYLLHHVSTVVYRQADQALQERLGLGLSQFKILMICQWRPQVTQRDLANCLGQTEASISRQVKLLHEKGMLVTRIDPDERRRHLTTTTAKGVKITAAAREVLGQYQAPILEMLGPKQQEQLLNALQQIHNFVCAPGRRMACEQPANTEAMFANKKAKET